MIYFVHKEEILLLREELRSRQGRELRMQSFHDRLLSFGTVPIGPVEAAILEQKL